MQAQQNASSNSPAPGQKRALLSVSDKTGLEILGKNLTTAGFELVATHSTAQFLAAHGVACRNIEELTRMPEMLGGRVKTLHPAIFAGILWKRESQDDERDLVAQAFESIDLVVCNLYPFAAHAHLAELDALIEYIDVGGVSLLRAAAKNYKYCTVLCDPTDYVIASEAFLLNNSVTLTERHRLACKAFRITAQYDATIANRLVQQSNGELPQTLLVSAEQKKKLRYGENPHQQAGVYEFVSMQQPKNSLAAIDALQGKELSYNNFLDAEHALRLVRDLTALQPIKSVVAILKHNTPCGVAIHEKSLIEAYNSAFASDPVSPFGGIVCCNQPVDEEFAKRLMETFLEVVIAPGFSAAARALLVHKKNLRLLELDASTLPQMPWQLISIHGGLLVQTPDTQTPAEQMRCVTKKQNATKQQLDDLSFAMTVVKHVRSNAIVLVHNQRTLAIAGGFTNRIDAVQHCLHKLKEQEVEHLVLASDGFFPFADSIAALQGSGITHIVQPGGSQRDSEVIEACNQFDLTMYLTDMRHFKH